MADSGKSHGSLILPAQHSVLRFVVAVVSNSHHLGQRRDQVLHPLQQLSTVSSSNVCAWTMLSKVSCGTSPYFSWY